MIEPGTTWEGPLRIPLDRIIVTQHERRYPERILHYWRLLIDPANAQKDVGPPLILAPYGVDARGDLWTIVDGHHRYYASIMAQRRDLLALIQYAPGTERRRRRGSTGRARHARARRSLDTVALA